jgi:hypothetical protein
MTNQDFITQEAEISLLFENARAELDAIEELSHKEKLLLPRFIKSCKVLCGTL